MAMWDEDIPDINGIPAERIREAAEKARIAFFTSLAEDFPEITTGDLDPGSTVSFELETNAVIVNWLSWNTEEVTDDAATAPA
jgi:hypothetical protein